VDVLSNSSEERVRVGWDLKSASAFSELDCGNSRLAGSVSQILQIRCCSTELPQKLRAPAERVMCHG